MYCSGCGAAATTGVTFCPRCGTQLVATQTLTAPAPEKLLDVIKVLAIVAAVFGVFGIGATVKAVIALIGLGVEVPAAITLALFLSGTVFGGLFLLTRQMSKVLNAYLRGGVQESTPAQLNPAQPPQLEAARAPFISVTEHTTRSLSG